MKRPSIINAIINLNKKSLYNIKDNIVNSGNLGKNLKPTDFGLGDIPVLSLVCKDADFYRNGGFIETGAGNGLYRIYSDKNFIGIGVVSDGILRPKRTI